MKGRRAWSGLFGADLEQEVWEYVFGEEGIGRLHEDESR